MGVRKLTLEYIVFKLDELPVLPTIVYELSQKINDPMSSTKEITNIMQNDLSLTTKVLKLANSAYYAIPGGVSSLNRAIAYLGLDTVNQLVLSSSVLKALETESSASFDMNDFWKHSIGVAIASETIAKNIKHSMPSDLFTAGLVHDMGKVALYTIAPDDMLEVVAHATKNNTSYFEAEKEIGAFKHSEVGGLLSEKWKLPLHMHAAIKHHHNKEHNTRSGISAELNQVVDIVYLGNLLVHALKFGNSGHKKILGAPKDLMERLGINPTSGFKTILLEIKQTLEKADGFIQLITGK